MKFVITYLERKVLIWLKRIHSIMCVGVGRRVMNNMKHCEGVG